MRRGRTTAPVIAALTGALLTTCVTAHAHDGPPYPIVSNQVLGAYRVSVWTDPDTTEDGSAGGQFWVMIDAAQSGAQVPSGIRARVTVRPLDRPGPPVTAAAAPVSGDPKRQFAALTMDHEGRFAVRVDVESGAERVGVDAEVEATYDLRPSRAVLVVYLVPFLLAGFLWTSLLVRRRRAQARSGR